MTDEGRKHNGETAATPDDEALAGAAEATRDAQAAAAADVEVIDVSGREREESDDEAAGAGTACEGTEDHAPALSEPTGALAESLEEALIEARRAASENLDRALRAQAELENVRRRMERDLQNAHKFALERFVSELLPVKDSLELGLAASAEPGASVASIAEGVELTLRMLEQAMEKFGITVVDPAGEPFDPAFHQAMTMQESDTAESGAVLTVVQKGYVLNDRLVRPAMVIVAK